VSPFCGETGPSADSRAANCVGISRERFRCDCVQDSLCLHARCTLNYDFLSFGYIKIASKAVPRDFKEFHSGVCFQYCTELDVFAVLYFSR
jgi:hypothetical protein